MKKFSLRPQIAVFFAAALLYTPIFYELYASRWAAIDYAHAYFILPVAAWLVWRRRNDLLPSLRPTTPATICGGNLRPLWLFLLALGLFLFVIGTRHDYGFITTLSLIPALFGMSGFLYGARVARILCFPILYLLFLVPPPAGILDAVTLPMRYFVSAAAAWALGLFRYPITREGLMLSIGGHQLYMGAPCSGFRSLITMLALGTAYIYLIKAARRTKIMMAAAMIPLALLGNAIRIIVLCLITYYFGEAAAQGFFHNFSGLVIFIVMLAGLLWLEGLLDG